MPIWTQGMQRTWWPEASTIIVTGPYLITVQPKKFRCGFVFWHQSILPISLNVTPLPMGQSYDCSSASEVMWKIWLIINITLPRTMIWSQQNNGVCIFIRYNIYTEGPFYWHDLTLIPARISNHMHSNVWDEIFTYSKNSTVTPLKFE